MRAIQEYDLIKLGAASYAQLGHGNEAGAATNYKLHEFLLIEQLMQEAQENDDH